MGVVKRNKPVEIEIRIEVDIPKKMACYFCGGLVPNTKWRGAPICEPCWASKVEKQ